MELLRYLGLLELGVSAALAAFALVLLLIILVPALGWYLAS